MSGNPTQRAKSDTIHFALSMGKRPHFASGGVVGPLLGADGGRADTRAISVPSGAYVVPADVVSGLPAAQGNSLAGHAALSKLFASMPLSPDKAPYGASDPKLPKGKTMPGLATAHHHLTETLAKGGHVDDEHGEPIDIMAADGEYVVHPSVVRAIGMGDLKRGHEILDAFVKEMRKKHIKTLSKLPGPVRK